MGAAGRQEEQLARLGVVHGSHDGHVGQVRTAAIRVVGDEHVAGCEVGIVGQDVLDRFAHRTQVDRDVRRIDDQFARGREHGATEIEPLLHVGRDGGPLQRDAHLLGDRGEEVIEDLELDRIGFGRDDGRLAAPP